MKKEIFLVDSQTKLTFSNQKSILDVLLENSVEISHSCGGLGTCGTCRVFITPHEKLNNRNEIEKERASDLNFLENERLSCQTQPLSGIKIKIP